MKSGLVLKSASPRRKQILQNLGFSFSVRPANVDESQKNTEQPLDYLRRITLLKLEEENAKNTLYISSDTIVVLDDSILHKPETPEKNLDLLLRLSGKKHSVYSGLALRKEETEVFLYEETEIILKDLQKSEWEKYILEEKPYDKAGGYGIQDRFSPVLTFSGSYSNVVGFPLRRFFECFDLWRDCLDL
ncbi:MAG: septum formation protein Maf [Leptospiraceae bacterium]|nr:septum formation protein Maf [Leptospiraceae bacterium]MCP5510470.1 septum formation protein Maf [Leptospiraceae bacterium]